MLETVKMVVWNWRPTLVNHERDSGTGSMGTIRNRLTLAVACAWPRGQLEILTRSPGSESSAESSTKVYLDSGLERGQASNGE
jgi:hypothetical protein